jgi:HPt (histidine-containing phosphotransfer) domain-containing protein
VVEAHDVAEALTILAGGQTFDVALLGAPLADSTVLDAFATLHTTAPDLPVVVLPSVPCDHLARAIDTAARNPRTGAAHARRVASLVAGYLGRRARDVDTVAEAIEHADFEAVGRVGHNLRGNGVSFGFPELSAIGEALEAAATEGRLDSIREGARRLKECVERVAGPRR